MSKYEAIKFSIADQIATITLNRPEVSNAINIQMCKELLEVIRIASEDEAVRIVVITGEGKNFSSGADLSDPIISEGHKPSTLLDENFKPFIMAIYNSKKTFISAANGAVAGVSSALVMICDLTVMAEDAYLYPAFINLSLIPDGGSSWHLVNQLGYKRAYEMVVEGEKMPAATCKDLGLINRVVPSDQLMEKTHAWARDLLKKPPLALAYTKEALQKTVYADLEQTMKIEVDIQNVLNETLDSKEGIAAFFEKRSPVFQGK
jgi:2-(1,2-epoxy-1,2-dihydrophenyl)acetyl-CoA isomerase